MNLSVNDNVFTRLAPDECSEYPRGCEACPQTANSNIAGAAPQGVKDNKTPKQLYIDLADATIKFDQKYLQRSGVSDATTLTIMLTAKARLRQRCARPLWGGSLMKPSRDDNRSSQKDRRSILV